MRSLVGIEFGASSVAVVKERGEGIVLKEGDIVERGGWRDTVERREVARNRDDRG